MILESIWFYPIVALVSLCIIYWFS